MATCPSCGNQAPEGAAFCPKCGAQISSLAAYLPAPAILPQPVAPVTPTTSGLAIVSFICGLLFFFFPSALAAIIFGHISRSDIRRSAGRRTGAGLALAGLVLGYIGIAILLIILIVTAIAVPNLFRSRGVVRSAFSEGMVISSLQQLNLALRTYSATKGDYPQSLSDLEFSMLGPMVRSTITNGRTFGYEFVYNRVDIDRDGGKKSGYTINANPATQGNTNQRYFFTDQTGE